jgi:hypothetical protein
MPVHVKCTSCRKRLHVPDHLAGHRVTCPRCGGAVSVPLPEAPEAAPAPPSTEHGEDTLGTLPRFGRLGVVSLGLGLLSVVVLCVPLVGSASLALSGLGLLVGLCGLFDFARERRGGLVLRATTEGQTMSGGGGRALNYPLAGTAVSLVALVLALLPLLLHG